MNQRPKITDAQWYFLTYFCGGNGYGSVGIKTQDSLEYQIAKECKQAGLIKKKIECDLLFELTDSGRQAIHYDILERIGFPYVDRSIKEWHKTKHTIRSWILRFVKWIVSSPKLNRAGGGSGSGNQIIIQFK